MIVRFLLLLLFAFLLVACRSTHPADAPLSEDGLDPRTAPRGYSLDSGSGPLPPDWDGDIPEYLR